MASRVLLSSKKPAITLATVSCDAQPTLSYTALEMASRVLFLSQKPAIQLSCLTDMLFLYTLHTDVGPDVHPYMPYPIFGMKLTKVNFRQMQQHQIAVRNSLFEQID